MNLSIVTENDGDPAWCAIHQHFKWCEHNGGVMGKTGWESNERRAFCPACDLNVNACTCDLDPELRNEPHGEDLCPACGGFEGYGPTAHAADCRLRNVRS